MGAYEEAAAAIAEGRAVARQLWVILREENERDGYALRPMPWEGPGEYQSVEYADGRKGFVRLPPLGEGRGRGGLPTTRYREKVAAAPAAESADKAEILAAALREIEIICTESAADCRKRMGTRVGNILVAARAALSKAGV